MDEFGNSFKGFQMRLSAQDMIDICRPRWKCQAGKRGGGESHQRTVAIGSPGVGGSAGLPQTLSWTKPNGKVALVRPC